MYSVAIFCLFAATVSADVSELPGQNALKNFGPRGKLSRHAQNPTLLPPTYLPPTYLPPITTVPTPTTTAAPITTTAAPVTTTEVITTTKIPVPPTTVVPPTPKPTLYHYPRPRIAFHF
jgi:hypothetical protein